MTRSSLVLAFVLAIGCGTDVGVGGGDDAVCTRGQSQACTCSTGGEGTQVCDDTGVFGACAMCAPIDPDPGRANFQAEIVPILQRSCGAGSSACHARNQYAANASMDCRGWLSLENAALGSTFYAGDMAGQPTGCPDLPLYERLMQIQPWECDTGSSYVRASDPARSYVMNKIDGAPLCGTTSVKMPPSDSAYTLSDGDKALIQQWISEGASNN
jgi:hypothetical protein